MSSCCCCDCDRCSGERPKDVTPELDEAAHLLAKVVGERVYYSRRGYYGGSRIYIGSGGSVKLPSPTDDTAFTAYMRTVKIDKPDHCRPWIKVSFEAHFLPVDVAAAVFRVLCPEGKAP